MEWVGGLASCLFADAATAFRRVRFLLRFISTLTLSTDFCHGKDDILLAFILDKPSIRQVSGRSCRPIT